MPFNNSQENTRNATSALRDILAPAALEIAPGFLRLNKKLARVFFVFNYPRFVNTNLFSEVIKLYKTLDINFFINPIDTGAALKNLIKNANQIIIKNSKIDCSYKKLKCIAKKIIIIIYF